MLPPGGGLQSGGQAGLEAEPWSKSPWGLTCYKGLCPPPHSQKPKDQGAVGLGSFLPALGSSLQGLERLGTCKARVMGDLWVAGATPPAPGRGPRLLWEERCWGQDTASTGRGIASALVTPPAPHRDSAAPRGTLASQAPCPKCYEGRVHTLGSSSTRAMTHKSHSLGGVPVVAQWKLI